MQKQFSLEMINQLKYNLFHRHYTSFDEKKLFLEKFFVNTFILRADYKKKKKKVNGVSYKEGE